MVRDAATVILVRDGPTGSVQVLLLKRNLRSDFVGGAHVFPGGAVDPADRAGHRGVGPTDAECSARLGLGEGGLAFWVAAVRECFEEAGVLLARRSGEEELVSFLDPAVAARFASLRAAVNAGLPLADVLAGEDLVLALDQLHYVSHWITPEGAPRRYDTRFFVAAAPPGQVPLHDDDETIATLWTEPAEALARHERGELELVLPTIRNLQSLLPFTSAGEVLAAARAAVDVPTVRPRLVVDGDRTRILLPEDAGGDSTGCRPVPSRWGRSG